MADPTPRTIATESVQIRQASWLRAVGGLAMVVGLTLLLPLVFGRLFLTTTAVGLVALLLGALPPLASQRRRGGALVLEPQGLRVRSAGRDTAILRKDLVDGYELPTARTVLLRLESGQEMIAELSGDDGDEVLDHMGVGVHQRALTAPLRGLLGAFTKGLLTVLFSAMFVFGPLIRAFEEAGLIAAVVLTAALTAFVVSRFGRPRVVIGIDGIRIVGGLRERFVPYGRILGASPVAHVQGHGVWYVEGHDTAPHQAQGIEVQIRDGAPLVLPTIGQSRGQVEALLHRIQQGRNAVPGLEGASLGALERHGRSMRAWREDLSRLALASGGFRDQAMTREGFERVLDDPRAPADQRVGAALALRSLDATGAPARIRIVAEASANDKLRVALEAAGAEEVDEEAIEDALRTRAGP